MYLKVVLVTAIILGIMVQSNGILGESSLNMFSGSIRNYTKIDSSAAGTIPDMSGFNKTFLTIIIVPGYTQTLLSNCTSALAKVLYNRGNTNVLVFEWPTSNDLLLNPLSYTKTVANTLIYKQVLANAIIDMKNNGLDTNILSLMCNSIAAHLCGETGRDLYNEHGLKINRIYALDPAKPGYQTPPLMRGLGPDSAEIVKGIYTTITFGYGMTESVGTQNVYINCFSEHQQGCAVTTLLGMATFSEESLCNHKYSCYVMCLIIKRMNFLKAYKADSCPNYLNGNHSDIYTLGFNSIDESKRGNFYANVSNIDDADCPLQYLVQLEDSSRK